MPRIDRGKVPNGFGLFGSHLYLFQRAIYV